MLRIFAPAAPTLLIGFALALLTLPARADEDWESRFRDMNRLNQARMAALQKSATVGLEVIVTSPCRDNPQCRWGHVMLRLVGTGNPLADFVVSFEAWVNEPRLDRRKGLLGGYRSFAYVATAQELLVGYYLLEKNQSLTRYVLPAGPERLARLKKVLLEWNENPALAPAYSFADNNCVRLLVLALERAGWSFAGLDPLRPSRLERHFSRSAASPYPALAVPSAGKVLERLQNLLPEADLEAALAKLTPQERALLRVSGDVVSEDIRQALRRLPEPTGLLDLFSLGHAPSALYGACGDEACARPALESARAAWSDAQLRRHFRRVRALTAVYAGWDPAREVAARIDDESRKHTALVIQAAQRP